MIRVLIRASTIPTAGLGLFAKDSLEADVLVGEYKGRIQEIPDSDGETVRATKRKKSQNRDNSMMTEIVEEFQSDLKKML